MMVAVTIITAVAEKETAKQAILTRLREAGATNAVMPASLDIADDNAQAALDDLLAAGTVREARAGLYFAEEAAKKETAPGTGFVVLLAIIIILSIGASVVALATAAG
jgi:hypothetical protein